MILILNCKSSVWTTSLFMQTVVFRCSLASQKLVVEIITSICTNWGKQTAASFQIHRLYERQKGVRVCSACWLTDSQKASGFQHLGCDTCFHHLIEADFRQGTQTLSFSFLVRTTELLWGLHVIMYFKLWV